MLLVALGGVDVGALPGVGQTSPPTNTLPIRKDVSGDPVPGTTFTVRVTCESLAAGATAVLFTNDEPPFEGNCTSDTPVAQAVQAAPAFTG